MWHERFLEMAKLVGTWSKDPSTQVGAVAVDRNTRRVLSMGYNGFPKGIEDDGRLNDREKKYEMIIHAEVNCILNAARLGISLEGSALYISGLPPCATCALPIIQAGIKEVYIPIDALETLVNGNPRWLNEWRNKTKPLFEEAGIKFYYIIEDIK